MVYPNSSRQAQALANRIREVFLSGLWIANTNFQESLKEVDWSTATEKIGNLNSIAELTYHVKYYLSGVLQVIRGGELTMKDALSFAMPPIEREEDWVEMKHQLTALAGQFAQLVETLSDDMLEASFADPKYGTNRRNIEAILEHSYYHLGQISLIKKLLHQ